MMLSPRASASCSARLRHGSTKGGRTRRVACTHASGMACGAADERCSGDARCPRDTAGRECAHPVVLTHERWPARCVRVHGVTGCAGLQTSHGLTPALHSRRSAAAATWADQKCCGLHACTPVFLGAWGCGCVMSLVCCPAPRRGRFRQFWRGGNQGSVFDCVGGEPNHFRQVLTENHSLRDVLHCQLN